MKRRFNTAGPCNPEIHYMIPADRRLPEGPGLVEQGAYFVLHAPASVGDASRLGTSSPFNIKLESLRLGDFTEAEVRELYGQHTAEPGQVFTEAALSRAFELTAGQPWLVNALGREVVEKMAVPASEAISDAHMDEAKERLILARATHLDSLVARLLDPRVRRVIEPAIAGTMEGGDRYEDDLQYVRDLGLIAPTNPVRMANPIYREVVVRVLSGAAEPRVIVEEPKSFVRADGRLDLRKLLKEFAAFWLEHGEVLAAGLPYHEVAPQLVLMAYLQRVVNGGGYIDREYGIGRERIDLLVRWPVIREGGRREWQREALELKVWRSGEKDPVPKGLSPLDGYLARLGLDEGVLVVFDRRKEGGGGEGAAAFEDMATENGRKVTVLRV